MQTVKQLRQLMPLGEMYEIQPGTRYIVTLPPSMPMAVAQIVLNQLSEAKVNCLVLHGDDIKFYELGQHEPQK